MVLIETVGVGQSETVVAQMSDLFVLLLAPAGGDELQGVKRGIMEIADMILVNKADGDLRPAALRTMADYAGALRLLRRRPQDPDGYPCALAVSALADEGLAEAWGRAKDLIEWRKAQGHWARHRAEQARYWFEDEVRQGLLARLDAPGTRRALGLAGDQVAAGAQTASAAAAAFLAGLGPDDG